MEFDWKGRLEGVYGAFPEAQSKPVINEKVKDMTNICMDFYQQGMFDMFNILMKMLAEKGINL